MATIDTQIKDRIENFVLDLEKLVRAAAVDAVESALGGRTNGARRVTLHTRAVQRENGEARPRRASRSRKGGRRTTKQLQKAQEQLLAYIKDHPGERMEQIGEAIHRSTKELRRPLNKLLAKRLLVKQGEKRASRYYLPDAAPAKGGKKKKTRRGRAASAAS